MSRSDGGQRQDGRHTPRSERYDSRIAKKTKKSQEKTRKARKRQDKPRKVKKSQEKPRIRQAKPRSAKKANQTRKPKNQIR